MSAYLSPDVVVVISRQRQQEIESQVSRWRLAKLAESNRAGESARRGTDLKSALLTRAGAVALIWQSRTARGVGQPGPEVLVPRWQA
jgi:hypothetical protein